jgi:nucleoid DNA-binding protein
LLKKKLQREPEPVTKQKQVTRSVSTGVFVAKTAAKSRYPRSAVKEIISTYHDLIVATLLKGRNVQLAGIGTLVLRDVADKPAFGGKYQVPAHVKVAFRCSSELKKQIRAKKQG